MKTKQKFFYMVLGGVLSVAVLLIGMAISPLTAERNGSFGEITCTGLMVVNSDGTPAVMLSSLGMVSISHPDGTLAISLSRTFHDDAPGGRVSIYSKDHAGTVSMSTGKSGGYVGVYGKDGKGGVDISIDEHGGRVTVRSKDETGAAVMITGKNGGYVSVYGKDGKGRSSMEVDKYGNGAVSTWDKNGYLQ